MSKLKIKQTTVVEQVMSKIKELISSGKYNPGDKIPTELELAEMFGVGRSSIREAVKIFNYLGVLESQAAKGTYVKERSNISKEALTWSLLLGNDDINEMVDLRGAIEMWAILKLSSDIKSNVPESVRTAEKLKSIVQSMKIAAENRNKEKLIEDDFLFHLTILSSYRNSLFLSLFDTLKSFLYKEIESSQMAYRDLNKIPEEHKVILDALNSGDPEEVSSAYHAHIINIKEKLNK